MLLEEFLRGAEELFRNFKTSGCSRDELVNSLRELANGIDREEFEDMQELHQYISKVLSYYSAILDLPKERVSRRLDNHSVILGRLAKRFLIRSPRELSAMLASAPEPTADVKFAKGVGEARSRLLKEQGIRRIEDLVYYIPRDYDDRRKILSVSAVNPGVRCTFRGRLVNHQTKRAKDIQITTAVMTDGLGQILLKWFNQPYISEKLISNAEYLVSGVAKASPFGPLEMNTPEFELVGPVAQREILPVYSLPSGISQRVMRRIFQKNISVAAYFEEILPPRLMERRDLLGRNHSYYAVHFPKSFFEVEQARRRLAYEELLVFEVGLLKNRKRLQAKHRGVKKVFEGILAKRLVQLLPFRLTNEQERVMEEIRADLRSDLPMSRLLQGDVGSGKTIIAEIAVTDSFEAGFQSAVMVPTAVLAVQHYERLKSHLEPLGIRVGLLIGLSRKSAQDKLKSLIASGEIDVVVGTHALIQESVSFKDLGLVIIDEQHRFGVRQREALIFKGSLVDTLVMTATPIPRTLALTVYGDLDVSCINELPGGRIPIRTLLINESRIQQLYSLIREEVRQGHQVFIVYPIIEESEKVDLKAASDEAEELKKHIFPDLSIELLHGRLSTEEKMAVMKRFREKQTMVLVSTSVVEVGVDIPAATLLVIEHPERFGLAQLHQLRGRIGRSTLKSFCVLVLRGRLSEDIKERLHSFASTSDGFKVAELDLKLRGPGEFFGVRQHGLPDFRFADIVEDSDLLLMARNDAIELITNDPDLITCPLLFEEVERRFGQEVSLFEVG